MDIKVIIHSISSWRSIAFISSSLTSTKLNCSKLNLLPYLSVSYYLVSRESPPCLIETGIKLWMYLLQSVINVSMLRTNSCRAVLSCILTWNLKSYMSTKFMKLGVWYFRDHYGYVSKLMINGVGYLVSDITNDIVEVLLLMQFFMKYPTKLNPCSNSNNSISCTSIFSMYSLSLTRVIL